MRYWFQLAVLSMVYGLCPAQAESLVSYKIVANKGVLTPAVLSVPARQRIKLELINQGQTPIEFENLQMHVEKVLAPNSQSYVVLNPLKPGTYRFVDEFHPETGKLDLIVK